MAGVKQNGGGASLPSGNPFDVFQINALGQKVFAPLYIASTGDYYVEEISGIDAPGSGSAIQPFKTVQYAIAQLTSTGNTGKNIKILGGAYLLNGTDNLHYNGTITGENGAIIVANLDPGQYLINNFNAVKLRGNLEIIQYGGKFFNNTTSYTVSQLSLEFRSYLSGQAIPVINLGGSSQTAVSNASISMSGQLISQLFENDNFGGAFFSFSDCNFSNYSLTYRNETVNGGSGFLRCSFYGTTNLSTKANHVTFGKCQVSFRPTYFKDCNFDMASITGDAIITSEANILASLSNCTFSRGSGVIKACIRNDYTGVQIVCRSVISTAPQLGTQAIDTVITNGFQYEPAIPLGVVL